jgi:hypothetical protein
VLFNDNGSQEFSLLSSLTDTLVRHCETGLRVPQHEDMPGMSLRDALARVPDPRARRGVRDPFIELLHLIVCAVISGARTLTMGLLRVWLSRSLHNSSESCSSDTYVTLGMRLQ